MNRVSLIGRLTRDLEIRYSQSGMANCRFSVAINRMVPAGSPEKTDFINCVAFGKTAENMARFVGRGSLIAVEGSISTGNYDDKDGKKVYTTDVMASRVQFLESKKSQGEGGFTNSSNNDSSVSPYDFNASAPTMDVPNEDVYASFGKTIEVNDDELPF